MPWIQLKHLELCSADIFRCEQILSETRNLEVLTVYLRQNWGDDHQSTPLILARLHTFKIEVCIDGVIFDYLNLPALKALDCAYGDDESSARLISLALRSTWSLRFMRLMATTAENCILCLRCIPSLEEVVICDKTCTTKPLIDLLANDMVFLPNLRALTIEDGSPDISALSLPEMGTVLGN